MTPRQRRIHERVLAERAELVPLAAKLPVGHVVRASPRPRFVPNALLSLQAAMFPTRLMLMREPDAVSYQEYKPLRKGEHKPRWRVLARLT